MRAAVDKDAFGDAEKKPGTTVEEEEAEIEEGVRKFWPKAKIVLKYFAPSVGSAENRPGNVANCIVVVW